MAIQVECSGCGGKFRAPDKSAGRRVKCPKCSAAITTREKRAGALCACDLCSGVVLGPKCASEV